MMVKGVLIILLLFIVLGLVSGPGFRRVMAKLLGLPPRDR
ncbi:hypothetical protein SAMN05421538_101201 [Paracoccus isoporae]|uniref:Uncharacterized protein n=1 Tax=Paracoccus isoporae TaxID=591205 RepID=A0A1G6T7P0_9RHOB|nr:hypothetical protein SAMN05421538_101201 [Paracoccus isoporae]